MAASHVGLGKNIVMIAFLLTFGAICLALALAFGLGGKEVAQQIAREQFAKAKSSNLGDVVKNIGASMEKAGEQSTQDPPPSVHPQKAEPKKPEPPKPASQRPEPKKDAKTEDD